MMKRPISLQNNKNNKTNKAKKMDEKYVLELGKMTNSIENLIKNQDKHYTELRDMLQNQRDHTAQEIENLKMEIKSIEKDRLAVEELLKARMDKAERFDIKLIAYASVIAIIATIGIKLLPTIIKVLENTPT